MQNFEVTARLNLYLRQEDVRRPDNRDLELHWSFIAPSPPRRKEVFSFGADDIKVQRVRWLMGEKYSPGVIVVELEQFITPYWGTFNNVVMLALQSGFKPPVGATHAKPPDYFAYCNEWLTRHPENRKWFRDYFGDTEYAKYAPQEVESDN